ncbi:thioesterase [Oleiphilus sp. HI0071]|uniref:acyl-CoA thioesterase n=1 Tax=unclassified Oleiphilus TaxID=2631174 RepID=UPI0007C314BF|nr:MULTISPECIES: thioesterase family protein [unclassified Oleiphilus]KZY74772.1 thioesterase [Oleiphilus sp. HI0065]KZY87107.1 thioesterase [Oleiphilus sp. HI0071]KZY91275.1 thioesterase [Oleiphilus sp. HI0073]KZZ42299.1 thioesterase [Oleiphilus sp. HI0118]KZZ60254.1 thioesterase [Oleiphilus sp. HI0122]KZZ65195.1 thioesterase [Oleiphilus sp. HI0130]KZZ81185.1 thioesterase [Oleiphilus sp. HI0133]
MSDQIENCSVNIQVDVAWGEMDAFQHVNNVVYFKYFESVRIAYFEQLDIFGHMEATGVGPILGSTQCRFKAPLTYPDRLLVATKVIDLEADRFTMKYFVQSGNSGRVAAEGEGSIVFYDYKNNRKHDIPKHIHSAIKALDLVI